MPFDIQFRAALGGDVSAEEVPLILTRPFCLKLLTRLATLAGTGWLGLLDVRLFQNAIVFDRNTLVGDLVECDFDGYLGYSPQSFADPGYDENGDAVIVGDTSPPWTVGTLAAPQSICGVYMLDDDGELAMGASIAPPIALSDGQMIPMTFVVQLGNS